MNSMKICLGGEFDPRSPETPLILKKAITSGLRLHSCFHYGHALDSIARAVNEIGQEPSMTLKIYFPSDAKKLNELVPTQLEKIKQRLQGFKFKQLDLQLCCNPKTAYFTEKRYNFERFLAEIRMEFPTARLLIESFVNWAANIHKLLNVPAIDGLIFYNNSVMREVRTDVFQRAISPSSKTFYLAGMRGLGGGNTNSDLQYLPEASRSVWQSIVKQSGAKSLVDFNVMYAKAADYLKYNVVSVSSLNHLNDLQEKDETLQPLPSHLFSEIEALKNEVWKRKGTPDPYFSIIGNPLTIAGLRKMKSKAERILAARASPWGI